MVLVRRKKHKDSASVVRIFQPKSPCLVVLIRYFPRETVLFDGQDTSDDGYDAEPF
jgi:hypothetical protein